MPSLCLYFQLHQPPRLRRYSVFDAHSDYFDDEHNSQILRSVAQKCYLPATELLLKLIDRHAGRLRLGFSLTGTLIEQLDRFKPEVLERFRELAETGCVEFLAETSHHSLASLYSREEFLAQLDAHTKLIEDLFSQTPSVFRNTELVYSNALADLIADTRRFHGLLAEGVDRLLAGRSPNHLYTPPGHSEPALLLKNYRFSDDVAFRFSDPNWAHHPLTAATFAQWVTESGGEVCNLFMDFETFGEHQWRETGIFEFLENLPGEVLARGSEFLTPSEAIERFEPAGTYDAPHATSWADTERDLSAWLSNAMQTSALKELFKLEPHVKATGDARLLEDWRKLTCSDHFYYMCTKYFADGDVHKYFSPYESPYDGYINYMNVLDNMRTRIESVQAHTGTRNE